MLVVPCGNAVCSVLGSDDSAMLPRERPVLALKNCFQKVDRCTTRSAKFRNSTSAISADKKSVLRQ